MKQVNKNRTGTFDVAKMRAAQRMAKEVVAKPADDPTSTPSDRVNLGSSGNAPQTLSREALQSLHQEIKPAATDYPNHQAGWIVGLMIPLASGSIEASRQTMEQYNFVSSLKRTSGDNAGQIRDNALKRVGALSKKAGTLKTISGAAKKIGIGTALGLGALAMGGLATLPLTLGIGGGTVLAAAVSVATDTMSDGAKEEATNTNRFAKHVQAYSELAK
jgi:hypothetical protein